MCAGKVSLLPFYSLKTFFLFYFHLSLSPLFLSSSFFPMDGSTQKEARESDDLEVPITEEFPAPDLSFLERGENEFQRVVRGELSLGSLPPSLSGDNPLFALREEATSRPRRAAAARVAAAVTLSEVSVSSLASRGTDVDWDPDKRRRLNSKNYKRKQVVKTKCPPRVRKKSSMAEPSRKEVGPQVVAQEGLGEIPPFINANPRLSNEETLNNSTRQNDDNFVFLTPSELAHVGGLLISPDRDNMAESGVLRVASGTMDKGECLGATEPQASSGGSARGVPGVDGNEALGCPAGERRDSLVSEGGAAFGGGGAPLPSGDDVLPPNRNDVSPPRVSGVPPLCVGGVLPPRVGGVMPPRVGGVMPPDVGGVMPPSMGGIMPPCVDGVLPPHVDGVLPPRVDGALSSIGGGSGAAERSGAEAGGAAPPGGDGGVPVGGGDGFPGGASAPILISSPTIDGSPDHHDGNTGSCGGGGDHLSPLSPNNPVDDHLDAASVLVPRARPRVARRLSVEDDSSPVAAKRHRGEAVSSRDNDIGDSEGDIVVPFDIDGILEFPFVRCSSVEVIREKLGLPSSADIRIPSEGETLLHPPAGYVGMFFDQIRSAISLPLHPFVQHALKHFGICPIQLHPNSYRYLIGCWVLWKEHGRVLSWAEFLDYFTVCASPVAGIFCFRARRVNPVLGATNKIHVWRRKLLFVSTELIGSAPTSFGDALAHDVARSDEGREEIYVGLESFLETIPIEKRSWPGILRRSGVGTETWCLEEFIGLLPRPPG